MAARAPRHLAAALLLGGAAALHGADTALPTGFGAVALGSPWSEVERLGGYRELTRATSEWERHMHACGYRSAQLAVEGGRLLVTAQDATVTAMSYATAIAPGSDVMKVAELAIRTYGPPQRATLRDALGAITLEPAHASYVVLEFAGPPHTRLSVSGEPLWEYRISVEGRDARRLENRTIRCARDREKAAAAANNAS